MRFFRGTFWFQKRLGNVIFEAKNWKCFPSIFGVRRWWKKTGRSTFYKGRILYGKIHNFTLRLSPKIARNAAPATKSDTPTSPNTALATKIDSELLSELFYSQLLYSDLLYSELLCSELLYSELVCSELHLFSTLLYSLRIYFLSIYSLRIYSLRPYSLRIYFLSIYALRIYSRTIYALSIFSLSIYALSIYALSI